MSRYSISSDINGWVPVILDGADLGDGGIIIPINVSEVVIEILSIMSGGRVRIIDSELVEASEGILHVELANKNYQPYFLLRLE